MTVCVKVALRCENFVHEVGHELDTCTFVRELAWLWVVVMYGHSTCSCVGRCFAGCATVHFTFGE